MCDRSCDGGADQSGDRVRDDEVERVHLAAVLLHLVVEVRAAHQPRGAHLGDHVAALHHVARPHVQARGVGDPKTSRLGLSSAVSAAIAVVLLAVVAAVLIF